MRLSINIDNIRHEIDSTDPELLGKWVVEIFARAGEMTNATWITFQAYPSWVPDSTVPNGGRPDWIADTRIIGGIFQVKSPRELVKALAKQIDEYEGLAE